MNYYRSQPYDSSSSTGNKVLRYFAIGVLFFKQTFSLLTTSTYLPLFLAGIPNQYYYHCTLFRNCSNNLQKIVYSIILEKIYCHSLLSHQSHLTKNSSTFSLHQLITIFTYGVLNAINPLVLLLLLLFAIALRPFNLNPNSLLFFIA